MSEQAEHRRGELAHRYVQRGIHWYQQQDLVRAAQAMQQALLCQPWHLDALLWAGLIAYHQQDFARGSLCFRRVLRQAPTHASAHYNLGLCLEELQDQAGAQSCYLKAIACQPHHTKAYNNLGILLAARGQHDKAELAYQRALKLEPDFVAARFNRARLFAERKDWDLAVQEYEWVMTQDPSHLGVRLSLAFVWLVLGEWRQGWAQYEYRWQYPGIDVIRLSVQAPPWDGQASLVGRHLLIDFEQGFGDTIQFSRFLLLLVERGARLTFRVQPELKELMASLPISCDLKAPHEEVDCDWQIPLMSLPGLLDIRTHSIPADAGYLTASSHRRQHWRKQFSPSIQPRIGLAWAGNPNHHNDAHRSLPLETLLSRLPGGVDYISLQKRVSLAEQCLLDRHPCVQAIGGATLTDYADTAGLCAELDLIICVDTSVAHLAGALNVPVWILLPYAADWRWLEDRSDTPWYQSARLFRQPKPGDWDAVLTEVVKALGLFFVNPLDHWLSRISSRLC